MQCSLKGTPWEYNAVRQRSGDLPTGSAIVSDIITACHQKDKHRYISFYNDEEGSAEKIKFNDDWKANFLSDLR